MIEKTSITVGAAVVLNELTHRLRFKTVTAEDGTKSVDNRLMPFTLRYKLDRNQIALGHINDEFEANKANAVTSFQAMVEPGKSLQDYPDKMKMLQDVILGIAQQKVDLSVDLLEPDELAVFKDAQDLYNMNDDALKLFIAYCTNDPGILNDLNIHIQMMDDAPVETKAEEAKVEAPVEAPVEAAPAAAPAKPVAKKTTAKKATTETKTADAAPKKTGTAKKSTGTKTTTKKVAEEKA